MTYIRAIVLTEQFALDNNGETNDRNVFSYFMTYEGGYYCNVNYLDTNPELFNGFPIDYADIDLSDIVTDEPVIL
tara:strand:+ start:380 stop:604 length:225 start_codon:yes stop_codon:yes gene_type:complete